MTTWDTSVDLVIAGSGGGGLLAAIAAIDAGLEPLVIEKMPTVGGSTGMSGGIVWMPNNPLMRAEGVADSYDDGMAYLANLCRLRKLGLSELRITARGLHCLRSCRELRSLTVCSCCSVSAQMAHSIS